MVKEVISRLPWNRVKSAVEIVIHPATAIDDGLIREPYGITATRIPYVQTPGLYTMHHKASRPSVSRRSGCGSTFLLSDLAVSSQRRPLAPASSFKALTVTD